MAGSPMTRGRKVGAEKKSNFVKAAQFNYHLTSANIYTHRTLLPFISTFTRKVYLRSIHPFLLRTNTKRNMATIEHPTIKGEHILMSWGSASLQNHLVLLT